MSHIGTQIPREWKAKPFSQMESPLKCPSPILRDAPVDDLCGLLVFRSFSDYKLVSLSNVI
jgi:hypothetical protein